MNTNISKNTYHINASHVPKCKIILDKNKWEAGEIPLTHQFFFWSYHPLEENCKYTTEYI